MKLSDKQMAQAVAELRVLLKGKATMFFDPDTMVTDEQIEEGIEHVLAAVEDDPVVP